MRREAPSRAALCCKCRAATRALEAALEAAFRKAAHLARLHPPFLTAAALPAGATAAMAPPALGKLLDVGNVRADGGSLLKG